MKTIANALSRSIAVLGFAILLTTYGVSFAEDPSGTSEENTSIVVGQPKSIEITPATIQLIGPRGRQQLNTTGHYSDDQVSDLTRATQWESSNPEVAVVENNVVLARSNGQTTLTAQVGSHQESVEVQVRDYEIPAPVSFFNETVAALSKAGCNGGACHGSPSGKNGFRLSLWGFEPELDFETLTHEIYGRRINVFEPEQSLVLLKPSMGIAHGGGRRMSKGEVTYEVLKQWIAEGLHPDPEDAPSVERIEVFPRKRILYKPFTTQQLSVQGYYSDGTVRDLTPLVRFRSSNENIGEVDDSGLVTGVGRGEIAVLVQFHAKVANARIMFLEDIEGFVWNSPTENNYVDSHIHNKLQQLQISPSDMSSSAEFV
ncbi:MAG: Ig-like domain-containing protein, partial [Planctomycetota bacterium]|nr:Ig-like domain-containing protein [Planctomycetota bacterium]